MDLALIVSEIFYSIIGLIFVLLGVKALRDPEAPKKMTTALFWFILAFTFIVGPWVPAWITGLAIVVMAILSAIKGVTQTRNDVPTPEESRVNADRLGNKVFIPAISLALIAFLAATLGQNVEALSWITPNNAIGISGVIGLLIALIVFRTKPQTAVKDGVRLMDNVGAIGILPQFLSALGALFTAAGVGEVIANGVATVIPENNLLIAAIIYCVAMALFTIIMGNGFAAFSVITVGVGIPFLIAKGADPVVVGALGLTAGYCGTLVTPMAANFNIMPAALLEVKDKYAIIKSQIPVALFMLAVHVVLLYIFAF